MKNMTDMLMLLASNTGAFGDNKLLQAMLARNMAKGSGKENLAMLIGMTSPDRTSMMASLSALGATPQAFESNQLMDGIQGQVSVVDSTTTQTIGRILGIETDLDSEFGSVNEQVGNVEVTLADVDRKVTAISDHVGVVDGKADDINVLLDNVEQQLTSNIDNTRQQLTGDIDQIRARLEAARTEISTLQATVDGTLPGLAEMRANIQEILRIIPLGTTWSFQHGRL